MADSDITVNGLTASGGVGQVALTWDPAVDPHTPGGLPYLQMSTIEVWAAASNNRAAATQIGESAGTRLVESGLTRAQQRYYWIRPRNKSGLYGEWNPISDVGGVGGQEANNIYDHSTNGYEKSPNGLLFQWGTASGIGVINGSWNTTFSQVFHFNPIIPQLATLSPVFLNVLSFNTSGWTVTLSYLNAGSMAYANGTVSWFAVGLS